MRLSIVSGYREYFLPVEIDSEVLAAGLGTIDPAPIVPRIRWHAETGAPPTCYATFLAGPGVGDRARRTDLLLEYLQDTTPPGGSAYLVLPCEPATDGDGRGTGLLDDDVRRLVERAQAALGADAVRCRRLYLSELTQAVLERLRTVAGTAPRTGTGPVGAPVAIAATALESLDARSPGILALRAAMQRNYGHAVLHLGERIVARASVFEIRDRTDGIARLLEHNQMLIRADLDAERILAELQPGGELFGLLTRPLPPEPAPTLAGIVDDTLAAKKVLARR